MTRFLSRTGTSSDEKLVVTEAITLIPDIIDVLTSEALWNKSSEEMKNHIRDLNNVKNLMP